MKLPLPDNGIAVNQGDTHFIYKGVYHPIIWRGTRAYRPRAETLVIKDGNKVFLKLKDSSLPEYGYCIPGGSLDADSTEEQQAENEVNEEALIAIKDIYNTGLYYIRDFEDGFLLKKGDICVQYTGQISGLYIAKYNGPFDKSKIDKHDLDPDMAKNGSFHEIRDIATLLTDIHAQALINSDYVDEESKRYLRTRLELTIEGCSKDDNIFYTRESSLKLIDDETLEIIDEPLEPTERKIPRYLYHGTDQNFSKLKAISIDFGNELEEPGWSLFLWGDYKLSKDWAIMRYLQRLSKRTKCIQVNSAWDRLINKPFMDRFGLHLLDNLIKKGDCIYIYTIDSTGYKVGLGNDITLDEYTIRDKDIKLYEKESIPITSDLIERTVNLVEDFEEYSQEIENSLANRGDESFLIVNNYKDNLDNMDILNKGLESGELKPGDDIEMYLKSKGKSIHKMSTTDRISVNLSNGLTKAMVTEAIGKNSFAINPDASQPKIKSVRKYRFKDGSWNSVKRKDGSMKQSEIKDVNPEVNTKIGDGKVNIMAGPSMARKPLSGDKDYGKTKVEAKLKGEVEEEPSSTTPIKEEALTTKQRNALDDDVFGLPEKRKYPLHDKDHVLSAVKFFNYADKRDRRELATNIRNKAREFGMTDIKIGPSNKLGDYLDLDEDDAITFVQEQTLYGIPSQKKIHLKTKADVKLAVAYFNKISVGHEKELAVNIGKRVKELGIQVNLSDSNKLRKYYDPSESEDCENFIDGKASDDLSEYLNYNVEKEDLILKINGEIGEISSDDAPTLPEINTIFKSLSKQERSLFSSSDSYDDTTQLVYRKIYKIDDVPIGFIDLVDLETDYNDLLVLMAIVPKYRDHKIATLMVSEMLSDMRESKVNYNINIHIEDIDSNSVIQHLVDKFGFDNVNITLSPHLRYVQSNRNVLEHFNINLFSSYYPILEAENDEDTGEDDEQANDYTDDEDVVDEEPTDYTEEDNTEDTQEDTTDDTTEDDEQANDYTDDAETGDTEDSDTTDDEVESDNQEEPTDDTIEDESATDYTEAGNDSDENTDGDDTNTEPTSDGGENADTTGENAEDDNSSENINVKNYNLLLSFNKLITMVSNTISRLETTNYTNPLKNSVIVQIIDNLNKIKDFLFDYITLHYDGMDYNSNLKTYYTMIQSIKINYKMLQSSQYLDASNNNNMVKNKKEGKINAK